jgi:tRNA threonylcarbamoyladenosine biosynthesis protein TsaE
MDAKPGTFKATILLESLADTASLAARIAAGIGSGDAVTLEGDLGAGKTALARAILRSLGVQENVPSPTFTLVQQYETPRFPVFHYDLYRIEDASELAELALDEALTEGVALIEWPDRMPSMPESALRVHLELMNDGGRRADIAGPARWAEFFAGGLHA